MARKKRKSKSQPGVNKKQLVVEALGVDPNASPSALAQQLAEQGIDITPTYVSNIKSGLKKDGGVSAGRSNDGINKTQAIKDYFRGNPKAMPKAAAADLTQQHGIEFKSTTVSTIKHQMKKDGELRRKRSPAPGASARSAAHIGYDEMLAAKELIKRLGSVDKAREALDKYVKLVK